MTNEITLVYGHMSKIEIRLDLVNRYNHCIGQSDGATATIQAKFIRGDMTPEDAIAYVRLTEYVISQMNCAADPGADA